MTRFEDCQQSILAETTNDHAFLIPSIYTVKHELELEAVSLPSNWPPFIQHQGPTGGRLSGQTI